MQFILRVTNLLLNYVETRKTYGKILLIIICRYNTLFALISNYERPLSYMREGLQVQWPRLLSDLNRSLYTLVFKKRLNVLNSAPTSIQGALRLLSAPSGRF